MNRALYFRLVHAGLTVAYLPSLALTRLRWCFWLNLHRLMVGNPRDRRRMLALMQEKRTEQRRQYREHVEALRRPGSADPPEDGV